jgi:hypothetical protein
MVTPSQYPLRLVLFCWHDNPHGPRASVIASHRTCVSNAEGRRVARSPRTVEMDDCVKVHDSAGLVFRAVAYSTRSTSFSFERATPTDSETAT